MTEDDARQRWCPFVRIFIAPETVDWQGMMFDNRGELSEGRPNCIASDCMAWRWEKYEEQIEEGLGRKGCDGYCGLAGKT